MGSTFMKATYLVDSTLPFLNMCDLALIALALRSGLAGDGSVGVRGGLEDEGGRWAEWSSSPAPDPSTSTVTVQSSMSPDWKSDRNSDL